MRPGISYSASSISLRPKSASERSATLKSTRSVAVDGSAVVVIRRLLSWRRARGRASQLARGSRPGSPDDSSFGARPQNQCSGPPGAREFSSAASGDAATLPRWTSPCARSPRRSSPDFRRAVGVAFGNTGDDDFAWNSALDVDRTIAAFDGGAIVGTAAALSFELTVPGHALVPTAGVTMVGVHPTHRRAGSSCA